MSSTSKPSSREEIQDALITTHVEPDVKAGHSGVLVLATTRPAHVG